MIKTILKLIKRSYNLFNELCIALKAWWLLNAESRMIAYENMLILFCIFFVCDFIRLFIELFISHNNLSVINVLLLQIENYLKYFAYLCGYLFTPLLYFIVKVVQFVVGLEFISKVMLFFLFLIIISFVIIYKKY